MIKHTCNNIEEYLEHIKKIDIKYMQLKKGVFLNELISVSNNEIIIQYVKSTLSSKIFAVVPNYYTFFFVNSFHKQQNNGIEIDKETLVIVAPNKEFERISYGEYEVMSINIPKLIIEKRLGPLLSGIYKSNNCKHMNALQSYCNENIFQGSFNPSTFDYCLENILDCIEGIISETDIKNKKNTYSLQYNDISTFMKRNLKSDLYIPEIAEKFKITDRTLRNIFRSEVGISPKEYKNAIIMNRFKTKLLKCKESNINDVCIQCGIADHSLLSKNFKEFFTVSPSEYRSLFMNQKIKINVKENNPLKKRRE